MGKDKSVNKNIAIIGAGNMGLRIAQSLLVKKIVLKNQVSLTSSTTKNNREVVQKSDIIILAVKPQQMKDVLHEIKDVISKNQLCISIAAGVTLEAVERILGEGMHIARVMPNLAVQVGQSVSGWIVNKNTTLEEKNIVQMILRAIGEEIEVDTEGQLDIFTAISGSGPAYFFYITQLLQEIGKHMGLSDDIAEKLAQQTLLGSAEIVRQTRGNAKNLRDSVTSKGGTTEAAFTKFEKGNLDKLFKEGVLAAYRRAKDLRIS